MKVMVNGTFDILHRGHLEMLQYAGDMGSLLVCIDTDRRVQELKGETRPVNNQEDRKYLREGMRFVDWVKLFDSKEELIEIMKQYQPDVYVKGSDWKGHSSVAQQYCKQVIYYDRVGDYSTTNIIQHISNR